MNLDTLCAEYGHKIVHDLAKYGRLPKTDRTRLENTITKSLGVLQEDGVYAFFLFIEYFKDRNESYGAENISLECKEMLRDSGIECLRGRRDSEKDDFAALVDLTKNLDRLLLAYKLLEQTLIYARYHAKALTAI